MKEHDGLLTKTELESIEASKSQHTCAYLQNYNNLTEKVQINMISNLFQEFINGELSFNLLNIPKATPFLLYLFI
jgi:hypothetical protein